MTSIKVITFDLDNTLWDVEPSLVRAEKKQNSWLKKNRSRITTILDEQALLDFKKNIWNIYPDLQHNMTEMRLKVLYELQRDAGYNSEVALAGCKRAFEIFIKERCSVELYTDVLETIPALHKDFILGALTNGNADIFLTPAAKYFSFAYRAEDVGASKPSPELFEAAKSHTNVMFEEIVHIGDDPIGDIEGAKQVGAKAIWINRSGKSWEGRLHPDAEIRSFYELTKALSRISRSLENLLKDNTL